MARSLAQQALEVARDAAPHRPREGEKRWPMANALDAARVLIGQEQIQNTLPISEAAERLTQVLADTNGKVTDGYGHSRPIYRWLALHLLGTAARLSQDQSAILHVKEAVTLVMCRAVKPDDYDERLRIWSDLVAKQHQFPVENLPEDHFAVGDHPVPLSPLGPDDLIDAWTYRELVGMHGLHLSSLLKPDDKLESRVKSAALYHLAHTQPDYTTYQPWALAAFASDPATALFAEQQLHDVATHLRLEGPGGAVLPALLLADAAATMAGTIRRAW